jgi:membrane protein
MARRLTLELSEFFTHYSDKFTKDQTTTLAASLAYYAALSMAPLLILFLTVAASMEGDLQAKFIFQVQALIGERAGEAVQMVIEAANDRPDLGSVSGIFGLLTLIISASAVFGELKFSLNRIFNVPDRYQNAETSSQAVLDYLKWRVLNIGLVLSFLFILVVSLIASSVIEMTLPESEQFWAQLLNWAVSLLMQAAFFALIYRYVPDRRTPWINAFKTGLVTALLFVTGKELIGIYLGNSAVGSAYGAAGSVIVFLIWIYYSALIVFSGAQLSILFGGQMGHGKKKEAVA